MDSGCRRGGSIKLRELIEEHPAELAYDFRHRFNISIDDIGEGVSLREAVLLTAALMRDPSALLTAAESGWKYPVSREWIVAAHTFDLLASINSGKGKKPKPYPNPFPDKETKRVGRTDRSFADVRRILDWMNPKES